MKKISILKGEINKRVMDCNGGELATNRWTGGLEISHYFSLRQAAGQSAVFAQVEDEPSLLSVFHVHGEYHPVFVDEYLAAPLIDSIKGSSAVIAPLVDVAGIHKLFQDTDNVVPEAADAQGKAKDILP
jgi:hypothetical protein